MDRVSAFLPSALDPAPYLTQLPPDILLIIFTNLLNDSYSHEKLYHSVSLVCHDWKSVAESPLLWKDLFIRAGIPLPSNPRINLFHHFTLQMGTLFVHKLRSCQTIALEEIDTNIDFSECSTVLFYEDSHIIAVKATSIDISCLMKPSEVKTVTFPSKILSSCLVEKIVYCRLLNDQIVAFSIDNPHVATLTIDDRENLNFIKIVANKHWLISIFKNKIKQWDRQTGNLIAAHDILSKIFYHNPQINFNKLFWYSHCYVYGHAIHSLNLISGEIELVFQMENRITNVSICNNSISYLQGPNTEEEFSLKENAMDEEHSSEKVKKSIVYFDLPPVTVNRFAIQTTDLYEAPKMIFLKDLAIVIQDGFDSDKSNDDALTTADPDIIELIDLKNKTLLHTIQKHKIHFAFDWCITSFHDSLLYITNEKKVVKVTFPAYVESPLQKINKRPHSPEREESNKRTRLN